MSEVRRWSQQFRDPAVEREYQEAQVVGTRRSFRIAVALGLLVWIGGFALDQQTAGGPANYHALLVLRYGFGLPLLVAALGVAMTGPTTFLRWKTAAVLALATAFVLTPLAMTLAVPEPATFHLGAMPSVTAALVVTSCLWALWGVRGDVLLLGCLPVCCGVGFVIAARYPAADPDLLSFSMLAAATAAGLAAWLIGRARRDAFVATRALARERMRSEALLAAMLPASIAERLKDTRARIADQVAEATVLFADLAGFTPMSAELSAAEVVEALDDLFTDFDDLAQRHGLEKIKTIGDAYMVAGGVPTPRGDQVAAVTAMALDMRDLVGAKRFAGGRTLALRIGIDCGPVVAGVLGKHKPSYDLWGDIVNTASRMESHGVPGKIHVTDAVATRLRDHAGIALESRGAIPVKGKGEMKTWFVERG